MKRFIFWDYPRASFPYDIMVALILAFIFLTPAEVFGDRPRPSNVVMLPGGGYLISPEELNSLPADARFKRATDLVRRKFRDEKGSVVKLEPHFGDEKELKGFFAYTSR